MQTQGHISGTNRDTLTVQQRDSRKQQLWKEHRKSERQSTQVSVEQWNNQKKCCYLLSSSTLNTEALCSLYLAVMRQCWHPGAHTWDLKLWKREEGTHSLQALWVLQVLSSSQSFVYSAGIFATSQAVMESNAREQESPGSFWKVRQSRCWCSHSKHSSEMQRPTQLVSTHTLLRK